MVKQWKMANTTVVFKGEIPDGELPTVQELRTGVYEIIGLAFVGIGARSAAIAVPDQPSGETRQHSAAPRYTH